MKTEVEHEQKWHLAIVQESHEERWPDTPVATAGPRHLKTFRPDRIDVYLETDQEPRVYLRGPRIKQDGQVSEYQHYSLPVYRGELPWVSEIVEHERQRLHLGPGSTGVDW